MTIIAPLPFTLANGTTADATEVMANLNQIRDDVNSAAAGGGPSSGNVTGPAVVADGNLAVFDGTTGKLIKDGGPVPSGAAAYRGAVVYNSTNTTMTSTGITLSFDSESIDTDGIHSGVNPTRLTVPAGVTRVRFFCNCFTTVASSSGFRAIQLKKNGGDPANPQPYVLLSPLNSVVGQHTVTLASPCMTVVAGDYFEIALGYDAGAHSVQAPYTFFEMQILE